VSCGAKDGAEFGAKQRVHGGAFGIEYGWGYGVRERRGGGGTSASESCHPERETCRTATR